MLKKLKNSILTVIVFLLVMAQKNRAQDFSYEGSMGPNHWGERYHQCVGKHQSPINIVEQEVDIVELPKLHFINFDEKIGEVQVHNNGHTVVLLIKKGPIPMILGGPLTGKYEFAQLHFHWGQSDDEGSENRINNGSYPMELHMVFYKISYGSFGEAIEHPDGLAVLSFLYSTSELSNSNYERFVETLPKVQTPKSSTLVNNLPTLNELTFEDKDVYFTYGGSLTTPPCSEVVTWIEFKKTIPLSTAQIQYFRQLNDHEGKLLHNFRPIQPLYGRTIRLNIAPNWNVLFNDMSNYLHEENGVKVKNSANSIAVQEFTQNIRFSLIIVVLLKLIVQ